MNKTITISGLPGSGTTTVAQILKEKLGLPYVYTGQIFRDKAKEYNMNLADFSIYAEENFEIDREIDRAQKKILEEGNIILEGRLAGWLAHENNIPSLKVWLECNRETRIQRIVNREGSTIVKKQGETIQREESEKGRYQKIYSMDITDISFYDVVIDTVDKKPEDIADLIIDAVNRQNI